MITRREFCRNLSLAATGMALIPLITACEGATRLFLPEADPFVKDLLLNAPLALPLVSPNASFRPEYNKLWNHPYLEKPGNPTTAQVTGIIKETISRAQNSNYDPFKILGRWFNERLTIPPEPRKAGGVELLVLPTMNNSKKDRSIFSAGYTQRNGSVDFSLQANTTGFSNQYRATDKTYLQVAIDLSHERQHFLDFESVIVEGLARGIPYLDIVRSIENTNAYLFEARSYFLDSALSIVFAPWENSLKPDDSEDIRNTIYYQMYSLAEKLIKEGSSWNDSRWLNLMQKLSKEGKIITRRNFSGQQERMTLPVRDIVYPKAAAIHSLQFA